MSTEDSEDALPSTNIFVQKRKAILHSNKKERHAKLTPVRAAHRKLSQEEREAASKVPLEMLAREWLDQHRASLETRSYLVEKLLPTLVVGLDKLLAEVTSRNLVESTEHQPDFNPVNFIAQYLMRNNPRYSNFAEAHPYCKTMKQVSEELKRIAYSLEGNKLAELKAKSRLRNLAMEGEEFHRVAEERRRSELLRHVHGQWLFPGEDKIRVLDVKQALQFWTEELAESESKVQLQASLSALLLDASSQEWEKPGFVEATVKYGTELSEVKFNQLIEHMEMWAVERCKNKRREKIKELLISIFENCDPNGTNAIDRLRVLYLLASYYDSLPDDQKQLLRNPRQWPIMDVVEVEELEEDEDFLQSSVTPGTTSQDLLEFYEGAMEGGGGIGREQSGTSGDMEGKGRKEGGGDRKDAGEAEGERKGDINAPEIQGEKIVEEVEEGKEFEGSEPEVKAEKAPVEVGDRKGDGKSEGDEAKKKGVGGVEKDAVKDKDKVAVEVKREGDIEVEGEKEDESGEDESVESMEVPQPNDTGASETKPAISERKNSSLEVGSAALPQSSEMKKEIADSSKGPSSAKAGSLLERRLTPGKNREESLLRMREVCGMSSRPLVPSGPGAIWDHEKLNKAQFVQLMELFVGREPDQSLMNSISHYIQDNYTEAEEERIDQAQHQALQLAKRRRVNLLFDTWDKDGSGFLELEELQLVLCKWKDFSDEKAKEQAKAILQSLGTFDRLTRSQFQTYIDQLTENMKLEECAEFLEFLMTSVKHTFEEQHRGEVRKQFLAQVTQAGKMGGLNFLEAAKSAVLILHEDVKVFGDNKEVTVSISLLDYSAASLTIMAASPAIETRVLNCKLHQTSPMGVGFKAVDLAKAVHVLSIQKHGKICFFLPEHNTSEFDGSLVVVPIINPQQVVLGTVSVDSLHQIQTKGKTSFYTHEINFFQGVGLCLGEIHHWITVHQKLLKVAATALNWIHRRCASVTKGEVYVVQSTQEGDTKGKKEGGAYQLCLMLSTTGSEPAVENIGKTILPNENQFLDYLFECVDTSQPMSANVYGAHHLAYPIRDHTGCAVALVDLSMPSPHSLNAQQLKEITKVLKLLTAAFYKLSSTPRPTHTEEECNEKGDEKSAQHQKESAMSRDGMGDGDSELTVLFDQLMLADLKDKVKRVDNRLFAELRSYVEPPEAVLQVIRALLYILYPQQEFETWTQCKPNITVSLVKALETYDPLQVKHHPKLDLIKQLIDLPVGSLHDHGSLPAKYIYNWVLVCVPLLEYSTISAPLTATPSAPLPITSSATLPSIPSSTVAPSPIPAAASAPLPLTDQH